MFVFSFPPGYSSSDSTRSHQAQLRLMSGMVLPWLGGLLLNLSFVLSGALIGFLPAVCAIVIVAIYALFEWHKSTQPRPKNASPFDVDWSGEP